MLDATPPALRLWLPGVHTVSQNRTRGRGWIVAYRSRQDEARAVLIALEEGAGVHLPPAVVSEAKRVLLAISAGVDVRQIRMPVTDATQGVPTTGKAYLEYKRVTTRPLDVENYAGSTKGLTDCLRYAFPALLPDDRPQDVELAHVQEKCASRDEEGTWVVLTREQHHAVENENQ